jgi:hypothetical protein
MRQENPLINLLINIVIPVVILMVLSKESYLGPVWGLILALSFPLVYGLYDLLKNRHFNAFSILGLVSILLTGGIGLLQLDPFWLAVKEASIPFLIGVAVLVSLKTRYPLVKLIIYNDNIININAVNEALEQHHNSGAFQVRLMQASWLLAASFFVSAILNFVLARIIVVSPPGTEAFNAELGKMTALSYPVIVVPSMIILVFSLWFLLAGIRKLTQLEWEQIFKS